MTVDAQPKSSEPLEDQRDRDRARLSLDRNVIVEAGAGTGKTTLLTDRALFLLLGAGIPITEIVALTFTEKAAGEIRLRWSERLMELLSFWENADLSDAAARERGERLTKELRRHFTVGPEQALSRARAALEDMDKAMIGTLHSFAARLLRAYPMQAGVDPEFVVDEGDTFDEWFASEWAAWLDTELAEASPRAAEWIPVLRLTALEDLERLSRALCEARADPDAIFRAPSGMREWLEQTISVVESEASRNPPVRGRMPERLKAVGGSLRRLSDALNGSALSMPESLPVPEMPGATWPKSWSEANEERCGQAGRLAEKATPENEALVRRAAELILPFCREFRRSFAWRGRISFDGLLLSARDLARDHSEVREALKSKYKAFLVDEFQDTDPLQGELLLYLAERPGRGAARWEEVILEPGKLFVVGDPKQSIYRFRGADLAAYERFLRHMKRQQPEALECALTSNFRSDASILAPVNSIFGRLMRYAEGSQPEYRPISPARPPLAPPSSGIDLVVLTPEGDKAPVDTIRSMEAEWICDWILRHRDNPYPLKSIALLLRTTSPLEAYLDAFKERGIPYVVEAEKYFYGAQEVIDFSNLLRVLDDPSDRIALAGLLRSPIVGLEDAELCQLAEDGGLDYSAFKDSKGRVGQFYGVLREMRGLSGRRPLGEWMRLLLERTRLLESLGSAYHGEQTVSNLLKFARMASEASDARGMTLKGFIRQVSDHMAEAREEGESPLADDHLDAVRILTIHKAKGLEFPVVIVPNLAGKSKRGGDQPPLRLAADGSGGGLRLSTDAVGAASLFLEQGERSREQDEAIRLLYVAMTRAKERLILLGARKGESESFAAHLSRVGAWPECEGTESIEVRRAQKGPVGVSAAVRTVESENDFRDLPAMADRWKKRLIRRDSLQDLPRHAIPTGGEGKPAFVPWDLGEKNRESEVPGRLVGQVCHRVLQGWDWRRGGELDQAIEAAAAIFSWRERGADWDAIRAESRRVLEAFLDSPPARELAKAEILGRELPFLYGRGDGAVVRGSIDLLYRSGGKLWIADYKSEQVSRRELKAAAERYRGQGEAYREAVRKSLGEEARFLLLFLRTGSSLELS